MLKKADFCLQEPPKADMAVGFQVVFLYISYSFILCYQKKLKFLLMKLTSITHEMNKPFISAYT